MHHRALFLPHVAGHRVKLHFVIAPTEPPMSSRAMRYHQDRAVVINFRIQPSTKALLAKAAARSGRTLSAEAEHQLRRALVDLATPTPAIMATMTGAIDRLAGIARPSGRKWWNDPGQFDGAAKLAAAAFAMLRPPGPRPKISFPTQPATKYRRCEPPCAKFKRPMGRSVREANGAAAAARPPQSGPRPPDRPRARRGAGTPSDLHSFSSHSKPN